MGEAAATERAIDDLRRRWGPGVVRRGVAAPLLVSARGCGVATLDALLGPRGLPDGLTLLRGPVGSGRTTVALRAVAATQRAGGATAWIDAARTFDPLEAATRGAALGALPIVVPAHVDEALAAAGALLAADAVDLLVLDLDGLRADIAALERLAARARRTGAALVAITGAAPLADLAIDYRVEAWLRYGADTVGRRIGATLGSGPRRGASAHFDIYEGRGVRADLRIGRLVAEEVPCARSTFTGHA